MGGELRGGEVGCQYRGLIIKLHLSFLLDGHVRSNTQDYTQIHKHTHNFSQLHTNTHTHT